TETASSAFLEAWAAGAYEAIASGSAEHMPVFLRRKAMTTEAQIRVLIVEDHTMFAQALQGALDGTDDIAVAGVAASAAAGLDAARTSSPDIVLMDYRLPDGDGVETARALKQEHPDAKVVMLTATGSDDVFRQAINAGCSGYLTKDQNIDQL